jgi:hypothetical protein
LERRKDKQGKKSNEVLQVKRNDNGVDTV